MEPVNLRGGGINLNPQKRRRTHPTNSSNNLQSQLDAAWHGLTGGMPPCSKTSIILGSEDGARFFELRWAGGDVLIWGGVGVTRKEVAQIWNHPMNSILVDNVT